MWLLAQAPHYLIWFADQPWPAMLVVKQLVLELGSMLVLGAVVGVMLQPHRALS